MRAFVGSITHETNAFSPIPTVYTDYSRNAIGYQDLIDVAEAAHCEVIAGLCARAAPSAPTEQADYERLREQLLAELRDAGALDLVLLSLHGAQVAEGYADCEGDIVCAVRAAVGEGVVIGVLLDLHAAISSTLLQYADLVTVIKEYPHTDFPETARQLVDLACRQQRGEINPVTAFIPLPVYSLWHTPEQPSKALVDAARQLESSGEALHISLVHGFPWSDVKDAGAAVIVITDDNAGLASQIAGQFAASLWAIRDSDLGHYRSIEESLRGVPDRSGPVVVADAGDNPGAGTGSDATWILHAVLERKLAGVACALFWDPLSLQKIVAAGAGTTVALELGAHTGVLAGSPLRARFKVTAINTRASIDAMPGYPPIEVGILAAIEYRGVKIVVGEHREQVFGPRVFSEVGIDPAAQQLLIVKSAQHFYKAFAPIAGKIVYCDSPCSRSIDFSALRFRHRRSPIWPLDACTEQDIPVPLVF